MSAADQLRAAKALIDTPEKWTRGEYARDMFGSGVDCLSGEAVCFCTLGALGAVGAANCDPIIRKALEPVFAGSVSMFNDSRTTTHADIMALFDRAIAAALEARSHNHGS